MFAIAVLTTLVTLFIVLPTAYASVIGAPFVPAYRSQVRDIVSAAGIEDGDIIYELGAGNGQVAVAFAGSGNVKVTGFELAPLLYLLAKINLKLKRVRNCRIYLRNFYNYPLNDANVVYFFLMPKTVEVVAKKLAAELRPGARIVSYAFPIREWAPSAVIEKPGQQRIFVYKI